MVEQVTVPGGSTPQPPRSSAMRIVPTAPSGWVALALAVVGLGSWVVLPIITSVFGEEYPVTNSWVMPVIGATLIMLAAIVNVWCVWAWRQRSVLNIVAIALVVPTALFFTFIVVGEVIGGT